MSENISFEFRNSDQKLKVHIYENGEMFMAIENCDCFLDYTELPYALYFVTTMN